MVEFIADTKLLQQVQTQHWLPVGWRCWCGQYYRGKVCTLGIQWITDFQHWLFLWQETRVKVQNNALFAHSLNLESLLHFWQSEVCQSSNLCLPSSPDSLPLFPTLTLDILLPLERCTAASCSFDFITYSMSVTCSTYEIPTVSQLPCTNYDGIKDPLLILSRFSPEGTQYFDWREPHICPNCPLHS